jgi:hypothetical protein
LDWCDNYLVTDMMDDEILSLLLLHLYLFLNFITLFSLAYLFILSVTTLLITIIICLFKLDFIVVLIKSNGYCHFIIVIQFIINQTMLTIQTYSLFS